MRNTLFRLVVGFCLVVSGLPADAQTPSFETILKFKDLKDIPAIKASMPALAPEILKKDMNLGPKSRLNLVKAEVTQEGDVDYVDIELHNVNIHTIRLTLKGPRGFYKDERRNYKVLFVASGFFTGRNTVKVMDNVENVVIAGYEYPHTPAEIQKKPELLWDTIRLTTAQMAAAMQWLVEQGFANRYELYSVGVSLGGIFLPSAIRVAQGLGVPVRGGVFAYTGTNFGALAAEQMKDRLGADGIRVVRELAELLTIVHDPVIHLPWIDGRFLVIRGDEDKVFNAASSAKYEASITAPKEVVTLKGGHINIDQPDLIRQTQDAIKKWLEM